MPSTPSPGDRRQRVTRDDGSAVVEFLGVAVIVVIVALALVQLILALHVRNTMTASAYGGATHAALADRTTAEGAVRAEALMSQALGAVATSASAQAITVGGEPANEVTLTARMPLIGIWGPSNLTVTARALEEGSE
ncbi:TadE/TadG family type IV pilus assembly protein [Demequina flava]|uniref:TadE/TadG family type IV pilus assembly protein n=1 Tax=Demequina flava TaxID=1095025 RepID=UPI000AC19CA0|nr:TadE/TadG family type IV pilus assembly protein [Demequina flava]